MDTVHACRGLPVVIVLTLFGAVAATTSIIQDTNQCSCWCAPLLGNVVPYAIHIDEVTAHLCLSRD